MAVMTAVLAVYLVGLLCLIRHRWLHPWLMAIGMLADLGLTLWLIVAKDAAHQALGLEQFNGNSALLYWVHIPSSTAILVLYPFVGYSGWRLLTGRFVDYWSILVRHRRLGIATMVVYLISWVSAPGFVLEHLLGK